jgi:TPR repeat protein
VLRVGLVFLLLLTAIAFANAVSTTVNVREDHDAFARQLSEAMTLMRGGQSEDALEILQELALAEYAPAEAQLGLMYANGLGVEVDQPVAVIWFYRAARQGLPSAQLALGAMLAEGRGVSADMEGAYMWLTLAEKRSEGRVSARAEELSTIVKNGLSEEEIAAAESRVQAWRPNRPLPLNSRY